MQQQQQQQRLHESELREEGKGEKADILCTTFSASFVTKI